MEGGGGDCKAEQMVIDEGLTWGGEHTVECTHDMLRNCTPETCIILLTGVTLVNSIKRKRNKVQICYTPGTSS